MYDSMKRENEDNYQEDQNMQSDDNQQTHDGNGQDESQDDTNDTNNFNNVNNQDNGNGGPNPPKRLRRNDDEEVRLLIPSKMAGAIIGKGGHNIQKLRTEYKAQVNVGDCQGPERVITIGADLETCCNVIKDIMKHFDKGNVDECEIRVLLHQSLAGCVIGKGGSKIKELKDKIGCRLKIFSNIAPQSTDRVAQIIGKEEQCMECLMEIVDLLKATPIKGPIHNYDPHNFDDMYADEYGGYGTGMNTGNFRNGSGGNTAGRFGNDRAGSGNGGGGGNRGFSERGGNRSFSDRGGRGGGNGNGNMDRRSGGNATGNNGGGGMRDYVDPWAHNGNNNGSSPMMGGMNNFASNNMNMASLTTVNPSGQNNGGNNFGNSMDVDKTSTQVTIPKDLAGAIIGKGGGRIRRIRSESNAFIQIDEALPGSTDRIITITGTSKQIQAAQYMLQQSIRNGTK